MTDSAYEQVRAAIRNVLVNHVVGVSQSQRVLDALLPYIVLREDLVKVQCTEPRSFYGDSDPDYVSVTHYKIKQEAAK